jgi:hypothetical protein
MTEELLRIICEVGCLDYQPLARAGGCNRSLYAVCKVLLGRRVAFQSYETLRGIQFYTVAHLIIDAEHELDLLRSPTPYREEHERWAEQRLRAGSSPLHDQAWDSAIQKQRSVGALKGNMELGIREWHLYNRWMLRDMRIKLMPVPSCSIYDLAGEHPEFLWKWTN